MKVNRWFFRRWTPTGSRQNLLWEQNVSRSLTKLTHIKRSVHNQKVIIGNDWKFEFEVEKVPDVPFSVKVGFMQRQQLHQQGHNDDTFYQPTFSNALGIIGDEKSPDAGTKCDYEHDKISQTNIEILSCFRQLTIHNLLQTYLSQKDYETSNDHLAKDRLGYSSNAFDIRYQKCLLLLNLQK